VRWGREGRSVFVSWEDRPQEDFGLLGLAVRFVVNVAALYVAQLLVRGFDIESVPALIIGAAIFGGVNAIIKPIVAMVTCLVTCVTLGLFTLIINTLMLALTGWIARLVGLAFEVDGFIAAFLGALVISVVSTIMSRWAESSVLRPSRDDGFDA
jgi:putative membrane protein